MPHPFAQFRDQHRAIDAALDGLEAGFETAAFVEVQELLSRHYAAEAELLVRLEPHEPALAAKLRGQHAEVLEIAERLAESLAGEQASDTRYLARRLISLARHNVIEEERDIFPVAGRCE